MRKNQKSGKIMVEFYKDGDWVKLTKDNGEFYASSTLLNKIGVNLFHVLNLEETPSKYRKAAQKLQDVKGERANNIAKLGELRYSYQTRRSKAKRYAK